MKQSFFTTPNTGMYPRFKNLISDLGFADEGAKLVAGVSGGIDSMVLLDLLSRSLKRPESRLSVAHVNYMLRGKDSDADEKLVKAAAAGLGLNYFILRKRPGKGKNIQDDARRLRYDFFHEVAKKEHASSIATAHNMDDQAETILIHLIRGAGLKGLSGMRVSSRCENVELIRPLLSFSRDEIGKYAKAGGIKFREDRTNAGVKYLRNAVRHRVLPVLKEFNPNAARALFETGERLADDDGALSLVASEAFEQAIIKNDREGLVLQRGFFVNLPRAIRRRVLRTAFEKVSGSLKDLNADQIIKMDEISLGEKKEGSYRMPASVKFFRKGDILIIRRAQTKNDR